MYFNYFLYLYSKLVKKLRGAAILNSKIDNTSKIESGSQIVNSVMGKHSFCGYNCEITNVNIGGFCSIANGVIIGGGAHPVDWISTSPVFYSGRDSVKTKYSEHERDFPKNVIIGHDVWIGQNVLIKQGVKVGTGAVIGMGSIVTKDVEPYTIVAGNPARVIRNRFNNNLTKKLLESKWWDMDDSMIREAAKFAKEPELFLKALVK
jgi:acetyltransferase-like isoleucine patch superfamily enzyme